MPVPRFYANTDHTTATASAGRRFATRIFLPQNRLTPTQKIRTDPTKERLSIAWSVIYGLIRTASRVTVPWNSPTGIAEKMQPFPREADMTIMMIKSSTALANRMEWSADAPDNDKQYIDNRSKSRHCRAFTFPVFRMRQFGQSLMQPLKNSMIPFSTSALISS